MIHCPTVITFSYNRLTGHVQPCSPSMANGWHGNLFVGSINPEGYALDDHGKPRPAYFNLHSAWTQTKVVEVEPEYNEFFGDDNYRDKFFPYEFGPGKTLSIAKGRAYIEHLAINTGHIRRSNLDEVDDAAVRIVIEWLAESINLDQVAMPAPLNQFAATITSDSGAIVCTVFAPRGLRERGKNHAGESTPVVTIGFAQRSRSVAKLWALMASASDIKQMSKPAAPCVAAYMHPSAVNYRNYMGRLADFERRFAWAALYLVPKL